jgi:hypothetical protein
VRRSLFCLAHEMNRAAELEGPTARGFVQYPIE